MSSRRSRIGVCSWSLKPQNPAELAAALTRVGVGACQLALVPLIRERGQWGGAVSTLTSSAIETVSGMLALIGEDYSTLESIKATGGVAQDSLWDQNRDLAAEVAELAADADIGLVTFHAGFVPHDHDDPNRAKLLGRLAEVAQLFEAKRINIALETGQETADTLLSALEELDAPNVGVNFDPANMILYGMGDPLDAIDRLAPHVMQVHIKDALPTSAPGTWGREVPVGKGDVDWQGFLQRVTSLPQQVDLVIEREAGESREADIIAAVELIRRHAPQEAAS